jgi:hypothetical protein
MGGVWSWKRAERSELVSQRETSLCACADMGIERKRIERKRTEKRRAMTFDFIGSPDRSMGCDDGLS